MTEKKCAECRAWKPVVRWVCKTRLGRFRGLRNDGPLSGAFLWNLRNEAFEMCEEEGDRIVKVLVTVKEAKR